MDAPVSIAMALIYPSERGRVLQRDKIPALAESLAAIGLKTPLTVRPVVKVIDGRDADAYEIVAGRHRYEAALVLHWKAIDCFVMRGDETQARLWEIAENLHRAELTVQERSDLVAEWVGLVGDKGAQLAPPGGRQPNDKGIRAAVRELGMERTEIQRAVKIASIASEAKDAARDAGLSDNQSALLEIAREETSDAQVEKARHIAEEKERRKALRNATDDLVRDDLADELAEILHDYVPEKKHPQLLSLLEGVKPKDVIRAFRRIERERNGHSERGAVFDRTRAGAA